MSQFTIELNTKQLIETLITSLIFIPSIKAMCNAEFYDVCFDAKLSMNSLNIVSTDRFRVYIKTLLSYKNHNIGKEQNSADSEKVSVHFTQIKELIIILKKLTSNHVLVSLTEDKKIFINCSESPDKIIWEYQSLTTYLDYSKVVPSNFEYSFIMDKEDFLYNLKAVLPVASIDLINYELLITVNPIENKLKVSTKQYEGRIIADNFFNEISNYKCTTNDTWEQCFNCKYILDYVKKCTGTDILIQGNKNKPFVISPTNSIDELYLCSGIKKFIK